MPMPRKPRALCACGCGREVPKSTYKFFSNKCQQEFEYHQYIKGWKTGLESGGIGTVGQISRHIKRYLREKYSNQCSECGWTKKHPITGIVPLEVDHINGVASDNREENLRLVWSKLSFDDTEFPRSKLGQGKTKQEMIAGVAQSVEQPPCKWPVVGSNPTASLI
jgi:HNH endonuclease